MKFNKRVYYRCYALSAKTEQITYCDVWNDGEIIFDYEGNQWHKGSDWTIFDGHKMQLAMYNGEEYNTKVVECRPLTEEEYMWMKIK